MAAHSLDIAQSYMETLRSYGLEFNIRQSNNLTNRMINRLENRGQTPENVADWLMSRVGIKQQLRKLVRQGELPEFDLDGNGRLSRAEMLNAVSILAETAVEEAPTNGSTPPPPDPSITTLTLTQIPTQYTTTLKWGDVDADMAIDFMQSVLRLNLNQLGWMQDGQLTASIENITINDVTGGLGSTVIVDVEGEGFEFFVNSPVALYASILFGLNQDTETTQTGIVLTPTENNGGSFENGITSDADNHIIAGRPELLHGAYIDGGGGYNTLEVDMKGFFAQPFQLLNIQEIHVQNLPNVYSFSETIFGDSANFPIPDVYDWWYWGNSDSYWGSSTNSILDLSRASSLERLVINEGDFSGLRPLGDLYLVGIKADAVARLEGNFTEDVNLFYGRGLGNAINLEFANVTMSGGELVLGHNAGTVNLLSEGRLNVLESVDFGSFLRELVITGNAELAILDDLSFAFNEAHIDASANTGGLRVSITDITGDTEGYGNLEEVTIKGSQARDVIEISGTADGVWLDIDTGAGRDTLILDGVDAGAGSKLAGTTLTLHVKGDTKLDFVNIDDVQVTSVVLFSDSDLVISQQQFAAWGGVLTNNHRDDIEITVVVSQDATLSDLMAGFDLDSDIKLNFDIKKNVTLTLTAEELHKFVAQDGIVLGNDDSQGKVIVTDAGLGFSQDNQSAYATGGTIGGDLDNLTIIRNVNGFERPAKDPFSDTLTIDTTGTEGVVIDANDLSGVNDDEDAFSVNVQKLLIKGDQPVTFNAPVEFLQNDFTIDFSELTGQLINLEVLNFEDVKNVIGNGAADSRIDVQFTGQVGAEGNVNGLKSVGVSTYVVTGATGPGAATVATFEEAVIEYFKNPGPTAGTALRAAYEALRAEGAGLPAIPVGTAPVQSNFVLSQFGLTAGAPVPEGFSAASVFATFYVCDLTEGVTTLGLQGTDTVMFAQMKWDVELLLEGDGYLNWNDLPKAMGNPNLSNIGTLIGEFYFAGAHAVVNINNQGQELGLQSDGVTPRAFAVDGIVLDNAGDVTINVEEGNAIIGNLSADIATAVSVNSANDVQLWLDSNSFEDGNLETIDLSGVEGAGIIGVGSFDGTHGLTDFTATTLDFSSVDLIDVDAIALADGSALVLNIGQLLDTTLVAAFAPGGQAFVNIGNLNDEVFSIEGLDLPDGIIFGTVTVAALTEVTLDPLTDLSGITQLIVPEGTTLTMSAEQFKQLVDSEATIVTEGTGDDQASVIVDLNGDLTIGEDDEFTIDGSNVSFSMADGETLNVETFSLADGLQVTGDAAAVVKPLVNFLFDSDGNGNVEFSSTINVGAYQDVDLRILDALLDNFYIDVNENGAADPGENSQSIEDLLADLANANILNIYQEETVIALDPRDRVVVVEPQASPDGIEFSAVGSLADFVRSIDLTLQADANNAARIDGDIFINDGSVRAGYTMLTINTVDVDGAAVGPVVIAGGVLSDSAKAGSAGELLSIEINAGVDLAITDAIVFNTEGTEDVTATLVLRGAADVTVKALDTTDPQITSLVIDSAGYTGTLTVTGGSDSLELGEGTTSVVISGSGDVVLDTDEGADNNNGVDGQDLTSFDASGLTGSLTVGVIESVSSTEFTFTAAQGPTTLTLGYDDDGSASLTLNAAAEDDAGWTFNLNDNSVMTIDGDGVAFTAGTLAISGGTVVITNEVDLTALDLNFENVTIQLAADARLELTAEQLDGLNAAGNTFEKLAHDEDEGEEAGLVVVTGIEGDLTAGNEDLDEDLDLSNADRLELSGDATLSGTQVSGIIVIGVGFELTLVNVDAETDLSGIDVDSLMSLIVQADAGATTLQLSASVISGVTLTVEGEALETVEVLGVEEVVGAEGDADEGDINADFSDLSVKDNVNVVFQLDATGGAHLNDANFGATVSGTGSTTLAILGTGTLSSEGFELLPVGTVEIGEDATLALSVVQHAVVGSNVEGEGTLQVVELGSTGSTGPITAAVLNEDRVDYLFSFSEADDLDAAPLVTIENFVADSALALDKLDFTALFGGEQSYTRITAPFNVVNQTGTSDILSFVGLGDVSDEIDLAGALNVGIFSAVEANFGFESQRMFFVQDGDNTVGYLWQDSEGSEGFDGLVQHTELTQLVQLTGVSVDDLINANFAIA
ncbi:beta strand repeat-containing protein [Methylotuvimicrobium buryatense]|uniref:EF-hand domain-containing protein n=1 Tax=Methylotuvimicrobium buryatense TaxID=95641 RepID=A0A4P9USJ0_METBY|nr:hypothetical protein [Methylotuvimicrobium buryatense]QCW83500.1 hypothetical protein EQU24_15540 [Methylotuvimicrobium buryatense]